MATIATSQLLTKYYDIYRDREIIFSKEILQTLRVDPRQIYVKCNGGQWPCIVNSTSFQMVKIIVGSTSGAFSEITKEDAGTVQVRFCFIESDNSPLVFFVSGKVTEVAPYMNAQNLSVVTLTFTQRPPDDLILKLGSYLEARQNYIQRREERIGITPASLKKIGLEKDEAMIFIQNVPRRCIIRDLSFAGAKVLLLGLVRFLTEKEIILQMNFVDPAEKIDIKGSVKKADPIEGRSDIVSLSIAFEEPLIPMNFKMRINNYLTSARKTFLETSDTEQNKEQGKPVSPALLRNQQNDPQQPEAKAETDNAANAKNSSE